MLKKACDDAVFLFFERDVASGPLDRLSAIKLACVQEQVQAVSSRMRC